MEIREVKVKEKERFNEVSTHPLQSWEWGEFRKEWGNEVVRLGVYENDELTQALQLTLHKIPGINKKIGMLIKGPMPTKDLLDGLRRFAKENELIFIKLEPNYVVKKDGISCADEDKVLSQIKNVGGKPGKTLFTPTTFWIDLTQDKEEMMKNFKSKTRYNVRYAKRKGVEVVEDNSDEAFEKYLELMRQTVERQNFYAHNEHYHRLMWKHLNKDNIARLLVAKKGEEILTTWIVFVWHDFLYYPYGASSMKHKNLQANSRIMWEAILYGKELGLKTFDLWGREPGEGFTKFKEGFNPQVVEFLGTWDLPVSPLYYPFRTADFLRWKYLRMKGKLKPSRPNL